MSIWTKKKGRFESAKKAAAAKGQKVMCEVCYEREAEIEIMRTVMGKEYSKLVCWFHSKDRIALLLDLVAEEQMRKPWVPI